MVNFTDVPDIRNVVIQRKYSKCSYILVYIKIQNYTLL